MYKLEKIDTTVYIQTAGCVVPGIIDTFYRNNYNALYYYPETYRHCSAVYGDQIKKSLADAGIVCATQFGTQGINLYKLMQSVQEYPNTLFEIGLYEYFSLPNRFRKLLHNHKIVVHDYCESARSSSRSMRSAIDTSNYANITDFYQHMIDQHPNVILSTESADHTWCLPTFLFKTVSANIANNQIVQPTPNPSNDVLIPMWKPKRHRLDLLLSLHQNNLLHQCDWSLNEFNAHPDSQQSLADSDILNTNREHEFNMLYGELLPRTLYSKSESNLMGLPEQSQWNYNLYIASETDHSVALVTEKTYKGFISGLPTLIHGGDQCAKIVTDMGFELVASTSSVTDICDLVENSKQYYDYELTKHNFYNIMDHEKMCGILSNQILRMFDYFYNS